MLAMSRSGKVLMEIYQAMRERFGHQDWWPGDSPLEICVGAVLTQNTNWGNVEKAIANLKAVGLLSVEALHAVPQEGLARLIKPAGYFNIKARRLKNFIARVHEYARSARRRSGEPSGPDGELAAFLDRSVSDLREDLLSISGVGRETADSIALYAAGKCTFVVDAYTCRVLLRHGFIDADCDYEAIKELLESNLPADVALYNDFHAQFVAVGKHYCRPVAGCEGCPLEKFPHDRKAGTRAADEA